MRARIAMATKKLPVVIREISLRDKAETFLAVSPKGTVPVLVLPSGEVIDESLAIVDFALPPQERTEDINRLITQLHHSIIPALNRYKYSTRYPDVNIDDEKKIICQFFATLNNLLEHSPHLLTEHLGKADIAILPFVRQIYKTNTTWFDQLPYTPLQRWLYNFLDSTIHALIMQKYPLWNTGQKDVVMQALQ